jgi:hypothetical protein
MLLKFALLEGFQRFSCSVPLITGYTFAQFPAEYWYLRPCVGVSNLCQGMHSDVGCTSSSSASQGLPEEGWAVIRC